jgi:hypothetical protein
MLGGAGKEGVLLHWAAAKISASPFVPDATLRDELAAKMALLEWPKYAPLAAHAQVWCVCARDLLCLLRAPGGLRRRGLRSCNDTHHAHETRCMLSRRLPAPPRPAPPPPNKQQTKQSLGRRNLAIKLLEDEPSAAQQVPLLLSLAKSCPAPAAAASHGGGGGSAAASPVPGGAGSGDARQLEGGGGGGGGGGSGNEDTLARALRKAVESRDPDLVYLVLFAAYRARPLPEFWRMVAGRPTARNLFVKYTRVKVLVCVWLCVFVWLCVRLCVLLCGLYVCVGVWVQGGGGG